MFVRSFQHCNNITFLICLLRLNSHCLFSLLFLLFFGLSFDLDLSPFGLGLDLDSELVGHGLVSDLTSRCFAILYSIDTTIC